MSRLLLGLVPGRDSATLGGMNAGTVISQRFTTYPGLCQALDALPGWGLVTIELVLRELRVCGPARSPPLDQGSAQVAGRPRGAAMIE